MPNSRMGEYHKTITRELCAKMNRVSYLIDNRHNLSSGEYKEHILRAILANKIPGSYVTTGFAVSGDGHATSQIDIMVVDSNAPFLFNEGGLSILDAAFVKAIIEVKTTLSSLANITDALDRLANNTELIREHNKHCLSGIFVYNDRITNNGRIETALRKSTKNKHERAVTIASFGKDSFLHFWESGSTLYSGPSESSTVDKDCWHIYNLSEMSFSYFVSNVTLHASDTTHNSRPALWYPLRGGKERYRVASIDLIQNQE